MTVAVVTVATNLVAVLALATILAPGTSLADEATRASYVRDHLLAWRAGWASWVVAAWSLLVFYRWWSSRLGIGWPALVAAHVGFAADLVAESLLIAVVPERPAAAPVAFFLTGAIANGGYTVSGIALTLGTPGLTGWLGRWPAAVWASGIALTLATVAGIPLAIAAATALLFALFLPWLLVIGSRLR